MTGITQGTIRSKTNVSYIAKATLDLLHSSSMLFLDACKNKVTERPPIWMMRQAGRYLPEYRKLRESYSFVELVHNPELACEITLQPLRRFSFDAAILYCDILVISEYFGLDFEFVEGKGPLLVQSHLTPKEIATQLTTTSIPENLNFVSDTVKLLRQELKSFNTPLIGFAGSPFTVAAYLIEKQSGSNFSKIKQLIKDDPQIIHSILQSLTDATIYHCKEQIKSGAQALQIFDTWGTLLTDQDYINFSFNYIQQIFNAIKDFDVPLILFSKNTATISETLTQLPIQVLGVDWNSDLVSLKEKHPQFAMQGNLNPNDLKDNKEKALADCIKLCNAMSNKPGFIFNLGHGILPKTPLENVQAIVEHVQKQTTLA